MVGVVDVCRADGELIVVADDVFLDALIHVSADG